MTDPAKVAPKSILDSDGKGSKERTRADREALLHREMYQDRVSEVFRPTGRYGLQKLHTLRGYLWSYSVIMAKRFPNKFAYVDAMSGPGFLRVGDYNPSQLTLAFGDDGVATAPPKQEVVLGSPMLALSNRPHYPAVYLVEDHRETYKALKARADHYYPGRAVIEDGDCNVLAPKFAAELSNYHSFFFLDPEGLELDFATILAIRQNCPASELFILYPYHMAVHRCLNHEDSEDRLDRFFGTPDWRGLRDELAQTHATQEEAAKRFLAFYMGLVNKAGYRYVHPTDVIRSDKERKLYFLLFAGNNQTGNNILKDVDGRVRKLLSGD